MRKPVARATSCVSLCSEASINCTLRPGRSQRVARRSAVSGTGRNSSSVMRATNMGSAGLFSNCSMARASRAAGGPPCNAAALQGPRASGVGTNPSPSRTNRVLWPSSMQTRLRQGLGRRRKKTRVCCTNATL